ncbi:hypothetical protein [Legionella sp. CNM-4043-24]|uniref:hypothetical protein n=1 Tax=Legionella sp. CNM-4043-24 TaxID=3421646 RepID=UPI00403AB178
MIKYFLSGLFILGLVSCTPHDEQYYRTHPDQLQQAIKNCPAQQPTGISCTQLASAARSLNQLALELQLSPQAFGKKIIALQTTLSEEQAKTAPNPDLLKSTQQELQQRLAVIKWLTSPTS